MTATLTVCLRRSVVGVSFVLALVASGGRGGATPPATPLPGGDRAQVTAQPAAPYGIEALSDPPGSIFFDAANRRADSITDPGVTYWGWGNSFENHNHMDQIFSQSYTFLPDEGIRVELEHAPYCRDIYTCQKVGSTAIYTLDSPTAIDGIRYWRRNFTGSIDHRLLLELWGDVDNLAYADYGRLDIGFGYGLAPVASSPSEPVEWRRNSTAFGLATPDAEWRALSGSFTYKGHIVGRLVQSEGGYTYDLVGRVELTVDVGDGELVGRLYDVVLRDGLGNETPFIDWRIDESSYYNYNPNKAYAQGEVTAAKPKPAAFSKLWGGLIHARFYGPAAAEVAGVWELSAPYTIGDVFVFGSFGAKRQPLP